MEPSVYTNQEHEKSCTEKFCRELIKKDFRSIIVIRSRGEPQRLLIALESGGNKN